MSKRCLGEKGKDIPSSRSTCTKAPKLDRPGLLKLSYARASPGDLTNFGFGGSEVWPAICISNKLPGSHLSLPTTLYRLYCRQASQDQGLVNNKEGSLFGKLSLIDLKNPSILTILTLVHLTYSASSS